VRVQVDSGDRALDLNDGAKLELGSTAKLRTLVTYLELMASSTSAMPDCDGVELERQLEAAPGSDSPASCSSSLRTSRDRSLDALLDAAMLRRYSANPWEGLLHRRRPALLPELRRRRQRPRADRARGVPAAR
jgi:hypothetical protein